MANYSEELKQHLIDNEYIQEVHFDAAGNHHFNVHELNGKKYSRIDTDFHGGLTDEQASESFLITETASREEILGTPHIVTQEDIAKNPELKDADIASGETVIVPPVETTDTTTTETTPK